MKKMPKKLMIIIIGAVLLIGAAVAVYFFVLRGSNEAEEPVVVYNYAIENAFVTNVKDSTKLFKTTVILVVNEEGMEETLDSNIYIIRDTILFIMRNLTEADISSSDIRERLQNSIPAALNEALQIENIVTIYFSDFVMQ